MKKKNVILGIIVATIIFEIFWLVLCVAANWGWKAMLVGSFTLLDCIVTIWTYGVNMPESHQEVKESTKENKGEKK